MFKYLIRTKREVNFLTLVKAETEEEAKEIAKLDNHNNQLERLWLGNNKDEIAEIIIADTCD